MAIETEDLTLEVLSDPLVGVVTATGRAIGFETAQALLWLYARMGWA